LTGKIWDLVRRLATGHDIEKAPLSVAARRLSRLAVPHQADCHADRCRTPIPGHDTARVKRFGRGGDRQIDRADPAEGARRVDLLLPLPGDALSRSARHLSA